VVKEGVEEGGDGAMACLFGQHFLINCMKSIDGVPLFVDRRKRDLDAFQLCGIECRTSSSNTSDNRFKNTRGKM
jgi:hypothetical protein